jgi:lipopolysaccharide export LptBFGC system permease protein LptF
MIKSNGRRVSMDEEKMKHLEFIQNIITRMNTNSFQIKGWTITIVSAILAIYASTKNLSFILVAVFPTIIFWFLDSYYLLQERKFRGLYNDIAGVSKEPQELKQFAMRPDLYTGKKDTKYSYFNVLKSKTIWPLYLFTFIALVVLFIYLKSGFEFCGILCKLCQHIK